MGWREVEYEVAPADDPRLVAVMHALDALYVNGGAILRVFQAADAAAFKEAARSDLWGGGHWLRCFLDAPSVRAAVPELSIPDPLPRTLRQSWYGGFEFEGAVTHLLLAGGAYESPRFSEAQARRMSRAFVDALTGNRLETSVWRVGGAWTDWFYNVAWDHTFVVQQPRARRVGLLCVTDTD